MCRYQGIGQYGAFKEHIGAQSTWRGCEGGREGKGKERKLQRKGE